MTDVGINRSIAVHLRIFKEICRSFIFLGILAFIYDVMKKVTFSIFCFDKKWSAIIISLVLFLSTGCATTRNFELLPQTTEDFELEYADLSNKFEEVPLYEKRFRGFTFNTPYLENLVDSWGPADYEKTHWYELGIAGGSLAGLYILTSNVFVTGVTAGIMLLTPPQKTYVWQKGNYCIEVIASSMLHNSYRKTIGYWKWTDLRNEDAMSKACKAVLHNKRE